MVIFRLITQNTIDENIVQRAQAKRAIEKLIVHQDKFKSGITSLKETTQKVLSPKEILKILLNEVMTNKPMNASEYTDTVFPQIVSVETILFSCSN